MGKEDKFGDCIKKRLLPASKAIKIVHIDLENISADVKRHWTTIDGLSRTCHCWDRTKLYFLTEYIHPKINALGRPRVLLLFSNPHPESVRQGLFMSEKRSRGFWEILQTGQVIDMVGHNFCWDSDGIGKTVSMLLKGNYSGPLLFFDCLYQIPSNKPGDLKKLFTPRSGDFKKYIHEPGLERISKILKEYDIKTVLVFTREIFEAIVNNPGISKYYVEKLCDFTRKALNKTNSQEVFIKLMKEGNLIQQVILPNLDNSVTAIQVMNTHSKKMYDVQGISTFAHVLDFVLKHVINHVY